MKKADKILKDAGVLNEQDDSTKYLKDVDAIINNVEKVMKTMSKNKSQHFMALTKIKTDLQILFRLL